MHNIYSPTPLPPVFLRARSSIATQCQPTIIWVKARHCSSTYLPHRNNLLSWSGGEGNPPQLKSEFMVTSKTDPLFNNNIFHLLFADWGILQCIRYPDKILVRKIPPLLPFFKGVLNNSSVVVESLLSHTRPFWSMKNRFPQILGGLLRRFVSQYTFEKPTSVVAL